MSRDLRRYSKQTSVRLFIGGLLLLFLVGDGLIYIFYGPASALTGLLCLLGGLSPLLLIWLALWILEKIAARANRD